MDKVHTRIIEESLALFFKYGIRSVTMDDVAREQGISKKTLYNHVKNKADLVNQCVIAKFNQVKTDMQAMSENIENAIDELFAIDEYVETVFLQAGPALLFQLSKYYPEIFKTLNMLKVEHIIDTTKKNLNRGIKQGLYRADINIEYISYIYMSHAEIIEGNGSVPEEICHSSAFHRHHLQYHIRGIATPKGLEYLQNKLSK